MIATGLNADVVLAEVEDDWLNTNPRADVAKDFRTSAGLPIQGSPQIFWPDGSTTHNPGMTDHRWHGGLVHIGHTEPGEAEQLLLVRTARGRE